MKKGEGFLISNVGWLLLGVLVTLILLYFIWKGRGVLFSFLSFIK